MPELIRGILFENWVPLEIFLLGFLYICEIIILSVDLKWNIIEEFRTCWKFFGCERIEILVSKLISG